MVLDHLWVIGLRLKRSHAIDSGSIGSISRADAFALSRHRTSAYPRQRSEGSTTPVNPIETATQTEPYLHGDPPRSERSASDWISFQLHREALERFVPRGARVLEGNARSGHYIEILHQMGCRVSVLSESPDELESSQARARALGYDASVEGWNRGDLASIRMPDASFDAVVAYGAPLSYALERRDRALAECIRVLRPRGILALDVLSLWGTMHRHLPALLQRDLVQTRALIRSGNAAASVLGGGRHCHLFRAAELEAFLRRGGLELLSLSASSALSTGVDLPPASDPSTWSALLEYERSACVERGYLDSGSELIAVARRL
jgi:SAM-dependent methyltransferase